MKYIFLLLTVLFTSVQADDSFQWKDGEGNSIPEDASRKSSNGFGGWLLITPDSDWEEKWATPAEVIPSFTVTEQVKKGEEIYILVLFSNPLLNSVGAIDIGCDIKVFRPDGSTSVNAENMDCAQGIVHGSLYNTRMTNLGITYVAEDSDPLGEWYIVVDLVDRVREARVTLSANYTVLE